MGCSWCPRGPGTEQGTQPASAGGQGTHSGGCMRRGCFRLLRAPRWVTRVWHHAAHTAGMAPLPPTLPAPSPPRPSLLRNGGAELDAAGTVPSRSGDGAQGLNTTASCLKMPHFIPCLKTVANDARLEQARPDKLEAGETPPDSAESSALGVPSVPTSPICLLQCGQGGQGVLGTAKRRVGDKSCPAA